jgi:putative MATE family efflux protein
MTAPGRTSLFRITWPLFVEQALRMLIGTVDVLMVSHVSDGAVAGLSVANQVIVLFLVAFNFIGIGTSVVVTHHLGAGDRPGADQIAANAIAVNTWLGVAFSTLVYGFAGPMLGLMHVPGPLLQYSLPFLTLMGGTLFMESMNICISSVLRAHHHTRDAMVVTLSQNVLNVAGNSVVLFGLFGMPRMGVTGVALSGVLSRCVACIAFWVLLDRRTHLRLALRSFFSVSWAHVKRILHIGLPAAGEQLCYWTAFMLVTTFIARLGSQGLAVQSYTFTVQGFAMLFGFSIGLGTEILIGHMVGAGEFDRAYHRVLSSTWTAMVLATAGMLCLALAAPRLLGLFTRDPAIIATGTVLLRIAILIEPGRVFNIIIISSLRATGDVGFPIRMAALSMWLVWVPLAWILGLHSPLGLAGIWIAMLSDEWLRGILMLRRWRSGVWRPYAERSRRTVTEGMQELDPT